MRTIGVALVLGLGFGGCDPRPTESSSSNPDCPACECKCECPATTGEANAEVGELVASASRKMLHGDGEGCLADLDRVQTLDPRLHERLAISRGQCEMLVGRCQEGKQRIAHWYEVETAMTPERAATVAEQLASMRCSGGNATDRDRLLAGLFDLSDGAYMNKRAPSFCQERLELVQKLLRKVKPAGPDDTQLTGGAQALFHTAASCFARAGDCKQAYVVYRELFPANGLAAIPDPAAREKVLRQSFEDSIVLCQSRP